MIEYAQLYPRQKKPPYRVTGKEVFHQFWTINFVIFHFYLMFEKFIYTSKVLKIGQGLKH